ncbi:MAG: ACT domain-containing protein [Myxococcaceae bacterium]
MCRLDADGSAPAWAAGALTSVTRTPDELSVVCAEEVVPNGVRAELGFRCLAVVGPLSFATTGLIASLSAVLAEAGVSIFVLSTFDTDLLLVRQAFLAPAVAALRAAGHHVTGLP